MLGWVAVVVERAGPELPIVIPGRRYAQLVLHKAANPDRGVKDGMDAAALGYLVAERSSVPEEDAMVEDARPDAVDVEVGFGFGRRARAGRLSEGRGGQCAYEKDQNWHPAHPAWRERVVILDVHTFVNQSFHDD